MWSGLGYYNRAKNLLKTAKIVLCKHKKKIPSNKEELLNEYKQYLEGNNQSSFHLWQWISLATLIKNN